MDAYEEIAGSLDDFIMTKRRFDCSTHEEEDISYLNKSRVIAFLKEKYDIRSREEE